MKVPLLDLKAQYATIRDEIEAAIHEVVESQWFILGPNVADFETEIARYSDAKHAVGCASGSDAILLALLALGIEPGDEVICPTYTFFATAGYVVRAGGTPVFADIDPTTYNVDLSSIREAAARCKRLRAIMPVHLFGQVADMTGCLELGRELGVPVVEDAAQAIGARDAEGSRAGSRGAIGCFSFFPSKNLGGLGDGGMVTTQDAALADRLRMLRVHGGHARYYHDIVGVNSRLDALQAACLAVKLRHLDDWTAGRQANAAFYDAAFADAGATSSATPLTEGGLPIRTPHPAPPKASHIYNQYVIRVPAEMRDALREHLSQQGVTTEIYYPVPLHQQACFADLGYAAGDMPQAEAAALETIALPIYPELTEDQKQHVAGSIIEYVSKHAVPA